MGSPLADVLRGMLRPGGFSSAGSAPAPSAPSGPLGSMLSKFNQSVKSAAPPAPGPTYQQQPQTPLNSGQPGAPAGIGHQFTPSAWTPPQEQRYSGPNPATQLQQLMASNNPINSAGHTQQWYRDNMGDGLDYKGAGIDFDPMWADPTKLSEWAYQHGVKQK